MCHISTQRATAVSFGRLFPVELFCQDALLQDRFFVFEVLQQWFTFTAFIASSTSCFLRTFLPFWCLVARVTERPLQKLIVYAPRQKFLKERWQATHNFCKKNRKWPFLQCPRSCITVHMHPEACCCVSFKKVYPKWSLSNTLCHPLCRQNHSDRFFLSNDVGNPWNMPEKFWQDVLQQRWTQ